MITSNSTLILFIFPKPSLLAVQYYQKKYICISYGHKKQLTTVSKSFKYVCFRMYRHIKSYVQYFHCTTQKNPNYYSAHVHFVPSTLTYSSAVHTSGIRPNFYLGNYDNCSDDCPLNKRQVLLTNAFIPFYFQCSSEVTFPGRVVG